MNDYERIARVIRYLDEHHTEQPELAVLARHAGLSPFHFHRLFLNWAGVTPKDFLQCLTLTQVKESFRNGASILDSALDAGLSGPGRLHDLCVNLEAASPGEMKSGGANWTIIAGFAPSPFGTCFIAESPRGICHLAFVDEDNDDDAWSKLVDDWPNATLRRSDKVAGALARQIFEPGTGANRRGEAADEADLARGKRLKAARKYARPTLTRTHQPLRAYVKGTPFQVRVWRALLEIPEGHFTSYGRLAETVGHPTALRATGAAVGQNRIGYLIPCHRVIRGTGVIGNYRWGPIRKRAIVAWECAKQSRTRRGHRAAMTE